VLGDRPPYYIQPADWQVREQLSQFSNCSISLLLVRNRPPVKLLYTP